MVCHPVLWSYGISLPQDPRHFGHWVCHHYLQHMRPSPWEEFLLQNRGDERAVRCSHSLTVWLVVFFPNQDQSNLVSFRRWKQRIFFCALQHPEPDSLKVTAAANTGQRVSSEALKAWKNPSETLTLFGTWCQTIATSPPYHWHIITIVLTYSYLCILETSLGLITEALGYFGAAGRIYQSGRSKTFHSKYWTGHEVNSFVVEGFGQRATLTLNNYESRTDLLDDPAGTSKLARKQRSVIFLYIYICLVNDCLNKNENSATMVQDVQLISSFFGSGRFKSTHQRLMISHDIGHGIPWQDQLWRPTFG